MGVSGLTQIQKLSGTDKSASMEAAFQGKVDQKVYLPGNTSKVDRMQEVSSNRDNATTEKLQRIARAMKKYVESIQRDLRIEIDKETDTVVIQVISKNDGKVIRQVPPEELLKIAAKIEEMIGVLLDKSA